MSRLSNFITKQINPEYTKDIKDHSFLLVQNLRRDMNEQRRNDGRELESRVSKFLEEQKTSIREDLEKEVKNQLDNIISKIEVSASGKIHTHNIIINKNRRVIQGVVHEVFDDVLTLVSADLPVFLSGPAGSGKNVICKQVAESLGLEFHFTNAVTQEYRLTGFIDAMGKYHETEFYRAFKNGGIFFLDEMDASIPEVLVILNAAIANRYFEFPIGRVEAHEDFRIIAAGNTFGTGADNQYSGRYCLDAASLDRFSIIEVGYSREIEKSITSDNTSLLEFSEMFRDIVSRSGIECIFSYRALIAITRLERTGMPMDKILKMCLTKGIKGDDISTIKSEITRRKNNSGNKYIQAFLKL